MIHLEYVFFLWITIVQSSYFTIPNDSEVSHLDNVAFSQFRSNSFMSFNDIFEIFANENNFCRFYL